MTSASMPRAARLLGRRERPRHHHARARGSSRRVPARRTFGRAEGVDDLAVGHLALGRVQALVLEEEHRVVVADRRGHQADDVLRRRRA